MLERFEPPSIEHDPIYQQFHARAVPLGSPNNIDWSQCGLAKVKGRPHGNSNAGNKLRRVTVSASEVQK